MVVRAANRDEDDELIMLGMAEYEDGSENSLIFIVSREGEQDVELEMDAYCIVRETQATTYGGVTACELASGRLTVHFTEEAAGELDVRPVLRMDLQLDDRGVGLVRSGLREILSSGRRDERPRLSGL
ncbi:Imm10 family immunity protein [Nonomuraea muscovyensis]|uniref:Imm10 family immunity protein n=1 Tax=Nonomuraea muscovyensis TaxID=1124761 RepID=UPI0033C415FF